MKTPKEEINAFLGKDTEFEGKFSFTGAVRIDGKFTGEIESSGTLIVGEAATITSQIRVADMIISGEVNGDVVAENKIEISFPVRCSAISRPRNSSSKRSLSLRERVRCRSWEKIRKRN